MPFRHRSVAVAFIGDGVEVDALGVLFLDVDVAMVDITADVSVEAAVSTAAAPYFLTVQHPDLRVRELLLARHARSVGLSLALVTLSCLALSTLTHASLLERVLQLFTSRCSPRVALLRPFALHAELRVRCQCMT